MTDKTTAIEDIIESCTLDDFTTERTTEGTMYQHKEYMVGAYIYDSMKGRDDPETLLSEIKRSILNSIKATKTY